MKTEPNSAIAKNLAAWPEARIREIMERAGPGDVERALRREQPFPEDLAAFISPQAAPFIEDMAQEPRRLTRPPVLPGRPGPPGSGAYAETAALIWLHALATGDATEHTHRPALKEIIESLGVEVAATNEHSWVECGTPDFFKLGPVDV